MIRPGRTDTAPTAPARASRRPAFSCPRSSAVSSSARSHDCPHQLVANPRPCAGGSAAKVRSSLPSAPCPPHSPVSSHIPYSSVVPVSAVPSPAREPVTGRPSAG